MAQLTNMKREMFCRFLADDFNAQEAYQKAGYAVKQQTNPDGSRTNTQWTNDAAKLFADPMITERVEELKKARQTKQITPEEQDEVRRFQDYDAIDERWVVNQLQDLLITAKEVGALKIALESILSVAKVKRIGEKPAGESSDTVSGIPKIEVQINIDHIAQIRSDLDRILEEATDITPSSTKSLAVPHTNERPFESVDSFAGEHQEDSTGIYTKTS